MNIETKNVNIAQITNVMNEDYVHNEINSYSYRLEVFTCTLYTMKLTVIAIDLKCSLLRTDAQPLPGCITGWPVA